MDFIELPSESSQIDHLMIFMHGYGGNMHGACSQISPIQSYLPNLYILCPNGFDVLEVGTNESQRQWFSYGEGCNTEEYDVTDDTYILNASEQLQTFINEQLIRFNLPYNSLILSGFSQGGTLALYTTFQMTEEIDSVISICGEMIASKKIIKNSNLSPSVCIIEGLQDLPEIQSYIATSKQHLSESSCDLSVYSLENLGHEVNNGVIEVITDYIY